MDRFGIFVDAGYLYAAAGNLCHGTTDRRRLALNFNSVTAALAELAAEDSGFQHLRTYWYDGAVDAKATAQHLELANLPGIKLRLGRLVQRQQKGVDSRIVRDLIVLSVERAISTAYLLGGDEDLREGVSEAQERGVRVVLVAIEPLNEQNLSPILAMEADNLIVLDNDFVASHISLREQIHVGEEEQPRDLDFRQLGREFAMDTFLPAASPETVSALRRGRPRIPAELDRSLLDAAAQRLGRRHLDEDQRRDIRAGFWQAVQSESSLETGRG